MPTPEELARENIDALLDRCGWAVQDKSAANMAEVERRLSVVEEIEAVVNANLQRATRLCHSILLRAFTGGLGAKSKETVAHE